MGGRSYAGLNRGYVRHHAMPGPGRHPGAGPFFAESRRVMLKRFAATLLLALALAAPCFAQSGRWEVVTDKPEYNGVEAYVPIPPELHIRNEGSAVDGYGLCVGSSILINGAYQGVPGMEQGKQSEWWRYLKSRPGGSYPGKLEADLRKMYPDEKWVSWVGDVTDLIAEYTRKGYPVAATMNTGQLYNWQGIHHMVSLVHLDDQYACVVDNNDPGKYHWMSADDYKRRFVDGQTGWLFVWLRDPAAASSMTTTVLIVAVACVVCASAFRRRLSRGVL